MVRRAGEPSDFNLRSMSIGNDYAISLSHSLKHFEAVKSVNLRSNRLSEIGAYNILKRLPLNTI